MASKTDLSTYEPPAIGHNPFGTFVMAFIVVVVIVVILKVSGVLDNSDIPILGNKNEDSDLLSNTQVRDCLITETMCSGAKNCRAADGGITGAAALTSDGHKCCTYRCEDDYLPIRPCKSSEQTCERQQSCKMGNNITMPEAITSSGLSCCQFSCNVGDYPERACFSSEAVCPSGSYCYDFNGNVSVPRAKMQSGESCCQYTGKDLVCVPING